MFDFSKGEMTQQKIKQLKESLNSEFYQIFQLCDFVMSNSQKPRLLAVTLETLLKYLSWIPLGYIFETPLIQTLVSKVLERFFLLLNGVSSSKYLPSVTSLYSALPKSVNSKSEIKTLKSSLRCSPCLCSNCTTSFRRIPI